MTGVRTRGEKIRHFIIEHVDEHPTEIAKITAKKFDITRQAVNKHIKRLVEAHTLVQKGNTSNTSYSLHPITSWNKTYQLEEFPTEDIVWRNDIAPMFEHLPDNVLDIWNYGFTEMFNNAIDHSDGTEIWVRLKMTGVNTEVIISDNGVGIFKKIQMELGLLDGRHAILELAKGKLTTDPDNHSGEGIFFTSRMFDDFGILSGGAYFSHKYGESGDWILEPDRFKSGTSVWMKINNHRSRTLTKVFNNFASEDGDYGFTKTVVPVRLAQYGDDKLISRSQAKRLLARVEKFKSVIFDFKEVDSIGQAFADEVFRVFAKRHPEIEIHSMYTNSAVKRMIHRARSSTAP